MPAKRSHVAEVTALGARSGTTLTRLTGAVALTAASADTKARMTEMAMLAAFGPAASRRLQTSEIVALAAREGTVTAKVSELVMLAAYTDGVPDGSRRNAWAFDLDGHSFYVLDLGSQGTFLFDLNTGVWCQFETQGYGLWNMRNGVKWGNSVVAGDTIGPWVWKLDPSVSMDEGWRRVMHTVTALIDIRDRKALRQDSLRLTASAGQIGDGDDPVIQMRFSDDMGKTWSDYYTISLTKDDFEQEFAWRSLGPIKAPGRVIEISDNAGPIRLDGLDAEIDGLADGEQPEPPGKPGQPLQER